MSNTSQPGAWTVSENWMPFSIRFSGPGLVIAKVSDAYRDIAYGFMKRAKKNLGAYMTEKWRATCRGHGLGANEIRGLPTPQFGKYGLESVDLMRTTLRVDSTSRPAVFSVSYKSHQDLVIVLDFLAQWGNMLCEYSGGV